MLAIFLGERGRSRFCKRLYMYIGEEWRQVDAGISLHSTYSVGQWKMPILSQPPDHYAVGITDGEHDRFGRKSKLMNGQLFTTCSKVPSAVRPVVQFLEDTT
jgi:hypothetical protein